MELKSIARTDDSEENNNVDVDGEEDKLEGTKRRKLLSIDR